MSHRDDVTTDDITQMINDIAPTVLEPWQIDWLQKALSSARPRRRAFNMVPVRNGRRGLDAEVGVLDELVVAFGFDAAVGSEPVVIMDRGAGSKSATPLGL